MIFLKLSLIFSGDEGDRTPDLLTASQTLSQLSYAPKNALILNHLSFLVKKILQAVRRSPTLLLRQYIFLGFVGKHE